MRYQPPLRSHGLTENLRLLRPVWSYNLSLYTGTPLSTLASPAAVVEAHPSLNS